jgi:hypothetical protein
LLKLLLRALERELPSFSKAFVESSNWYLDHGMRPRKFNQKRKIQNPVDTDEQLQKLELLAQQAVYTGNPVHKRTPGDFGLSPPASPRPGKTLCDGADIFRRDVAQGLLEEGLRRGLISVAERFDWPQNVWAVSPSGLALEAMLEDNQGRYHGYPLQADDPLVDEIKRRWVEE